VLCLNLYSIHYAKAFKQSTDYIVSQIKYFIIIHLNCQAPGPGLNKPGPQPGQPGHQLGQT